LLGLWQNDLFDSTELVGMIEAREFGLVVMRAQFYPTDVLQAIARNYEQVEIVPMNGFNYLIFHPLE
jgi:hypothetical protein